MNRDFKQALFLLLKKEIDDPRIYQIVLKEEKRHELSQLKKGHELSQSKKDELSQLEKKYELSQPEQRALDDFYMKTVYNNPEVQRKLIDLYNQKGGKTKKKRKVTKKKSKVGAKKRKVTKHKK